MVVTCCLFCAFSFVDSKALAAVRTILVRDLSVFLCDVEYFGIGNAVFGVFFFRRRRFDLSDQDSILCNPTCNSAESILSV